MAGQPAPTDMQMTLTPFFLKSQEQRTFVPFVLDVNGAPAGDAAHVRARREPVGAAGSEDEEDRVSRGTTSTSSDGGGSGAAAS